MTKFFTCDTDFISATEWKISFRRDVYPICEKNFAMTAAAISANTNGAFTVKLSADKGEITIEQIEGIEIPKQGKFHTMNDIKEEVLSDLVASCELLPDFNPRHFYEKYCKPAENSTSQK